MRPDPSSLTRRALLAAGGGAAAGSALGALGFAEAAAAPSASADADAIVVGGGLAGLVATSELVAAGRKVLLLDQEPEASLGGQAFWSLGGLFFVDSTEQRLAGIKDSLDLARADWFNTAGFDRGVNDPLGEDHWAAKWANAYLEFASGEKRSWLAGLGVTWVPIVGWAERGGQLADGPGNSVPRFHITLGTGPGVMEPFEKLVRQGAERGRVLFRFRHRVDALVTTNGAVTGVRGAVLEASGAARGTPSSRKQVGDFELRAPVVIVTSGGIGGNLDLVRANWPARLGTPPARMVTGVPAHVDGRMLAISQSAGARLVNRDRMWHYTEGLANHSPIWPGHGIRVLAAPSSLWLDGDGRRFPLPGVPSYDTLGTLELIARSGHDHSWFVLNKRIIDKEFVLSGSEQNPELTRKDLLGYLASRLLGSTPQPVKAFMDRGADFVVASSLSDLVAGMNRLTGSNRVRLEDLKAQIEVRDRQVDNPFTKDNQVMGIRNSLAYVGDSLARTAPLHKILDPAAGPLIAIRMNILTRKTLGGLQTDLSGRVLGANGQPVRGLYAAGEVAGFGGGGVHGYRALEGTFLGGCLFSGRQAGRAAAAATA
ncbi:FAD-binding dehydrogenase [Actinosynnema pretiosum subsp. pretiosum]|uniref:Fumarate reductase/succinate dehydrogenase flavoprotein domain protein n=2 Tax=Actinosynnema TaxID=40566 RepID=C6WIU5_ACTMD|nr:fumarate reductase/succinate dehydrogenase flavoprotein domain protein [Actinosynnema mirum DSM 43827]AXX31690.1 Fumarate/succinate/L-aspartate dehydrogenase [Actinosynnema pretiosum subsp. pretiosum]QUF04294.1 FAD-binding dehydrogenase [Actinosynnema pretiosum subsp. pretiosum]